MSKAVIAQFSDLDVNRSLSRPLVSNENPNAELIFKTLKYGSTAPVRFASQFGTRAFINEFVDWHDH